MDEWETMDRVRRALLIAVCWVCCAGHAAIKLSSHAAAAALQSRVAYYQRDGVKMDYYYTTGTVKTAMDHPAQVGANQAWGRLEAQDSRQHGCMSMCAMQHMQGKTQMFRRDLSESQFQQVGEG